MAREAVHASTLIEKLRGELARLKRARFAAAGPVLDELMLDASHVKAHRSASGQT